MPIKIDSQLLRQLIDSQFPQWANLPIKPIEHSGWDNRTFYLGTDMLVRLPSQQAYASQVKKEQYWLPRLAVHLSIAIPFPIAMGAPTDEYPWHWSIYRWLPGESAAVTKVANLPRFASDLAKFLIEFQQINATDGPSAGQHSFHRGGSLEIYSAETHAALKMLSNKVDTTIVAAIWQEALGSVWQKPPVWVHGDFSLGNLLVKEGRLSAVIDFGQLAIGDPACDLVIAWTFFKNASRKTFRDTLNLDAETWARARGWALWKALIVCAEMSGTDPLAIEKSWEVVKEVMLDYEQQ